MKSMKDIKNIKPTDEQPNMKPTAEEIAAAQKEAETEARQNGVIMGRMVIESAMELAPLKARYYKVMHEELMKAGFSDDKAQRIVENLKI